MNKQIVPSVNLMQKLFYSMIYIIGKKVVDLTKRL